MTATLTEEKTYRDLIPVIVEREKAVMPEGFDAWGIKSVHPDLKTRYGFQWPAFGVVECDPRKIVRENTGNCPWQPGDGLCVGTSWAGMATGGIPAITLLLVAYRKDAILGEAPGKLRTDRVAVVAIVDGSRLLRESGNGANLRYANLEGANLRDANLRDADLRRANLRQTTLVGSSLRDADLSDADLSYTNLAVSDLCYADLCYADLCYADLCYADLRYANLRYADLNGADLRYANLRYADLSHAQIGGANLEGAITA